MSEWIKTSKKLPKVGVVVICKYDNGIGLGEMYTWTHEGKRVKTWGTMTAPKYWMPLPEPPTEGEE